MSGFTANFRRLQAEQRRQQRDALRQQKELARQLKDLAKLTTLELARLEVKAYENALDVLLSVHKGHSEPVNWAKFAAALQPAKPIRIGRHAFAARLSLGTEINEGVAKKRGPAIEEASSLDERESTLADKEHEASLSEWSHMRALAKRILAGEPQAYSEAISEFSSLSEISDLGSSVHVTIHSPKLVGCLLTVNGRDCIPKDVKALNPAGKLSAKVMLKSRFHEIYQDHVCSCVLRLAREMLALLPIETVLVTASVLGVNTQTGNQTDLTVLSVAISREMMEELDFEQIDPSDSIENFLHRGDVLASRKSGEFIPIVPLTPADLIRFRPERIDLSGLLASVRQARSEIKLAPKADVS